MGILISAMIFTSILLLLMAAYYLVKFRREHQEIVEKVRTGGIPVRSETIVAPSAGTGGSVKNMILQVPARAGLWFKRAQNGAETAGHFRKLFLTAGIRHPGAPAVFWGAKILCGGAFPIVAFFAYLAADQKLIDINILILLAVATLAGFYFPDLCLKLWIGWRKDQIIRGFPDALDLLVVCVEAGMGIDAAINRVAEEIRLSSRIISDELRLLNLELRAGKGRADALRNLGIRTDVEEVRSFTTLLIQTDRFGTSVAQALRVHSDSMRTRRYQRAEELAAKLPVKLMFPLILFIFPAIFVVIVGPAAIQIYHAIIAR
ncbi:MAG TPA: type II secretion system F family protein [Syntrophales bacterium]|nr:type II secretion system F family protein [Syntrophales bacterium]